MASRRLLPFPAVLSVLVRAWNPPTLDRPNVSLLLEHAIAPVGHAPRSRGVRASYP